MMILYVKDRCPGCDAVKRAASAAGMLASIDVRNIDASQAAFDEAKRLGARAVPVAVVNGVAHHGVEASMRALGLR